MDGNVDDLIAKYSGGAKAAAPAPAVDPGIDDLIAKYTESEPAVASPVGPYREGYKMAEAVPKLPPRESLPSDPVPPPSLGTAIKRGAIQGATLDFADELHGLSKAGPTPGLIGRGGVRRQPEAGEPKTKAEEESRYVKARDEYRADDDAAKAAHGTAFKLSELGGGLATAPITGGGGAAKTLGGAIKTGIKVGASTGGVVGLGGSRADLTKGEIADAAIDTGVGAGVGAVVGGALGAVGHGIKKGYEAVKEFVSGAPKRVETETLRTAIGEAEGKPAAKSIRDPIADNKATVNAVIKDNKINVADPVAQQAQASKASADAAATATKELEGKAADAGKTIARLKKLQAKTRKPETVARVQRLIDSIEDRHMPEKPLDDAELLRRLADSGKKSTQEKLAVRSEDAIDVAKLHKLDKTVRDPTGHAEAVTRAFDDVGEQIGAVYDHVDGRLEGTSGVEVPRLVDPLKALARKYAKNPALSSQAKAAAVESQIASIERVAGGTKLSPHADTPPEAATMSARALREFITTIQSEGFAGSELDPTAAQTLKREIAGSLKGVLDQHMEEAGAGAEIAELNRQYSTLATLKDAADKRAAAAKLRKPAAPITGPRDGKIPLTDLEAMAEEIRPRAPSVVSQREAVKVAGKKLPSEKIAGALQEVVDEAAPGVAAARRTKEAADLLTQAAIERQQKGAFAPGVIEKLKKDPRLDLARPHALPLAAAEKVQKQWLDPWLARLAEAPPKQRSGIASKAIAEFGKRAKQAQLSPRAIQSGIQEIARAARSEAAPSMAADADDPWHEVDAARATASAEDPWR